MAGTKIEYFTAILPSFSCAAQIWWPLPTRVYKELMDIKKTPSLLRSYEKEKGSQFIKFSSHEFWDQETWI